MKRITIGEIRQHPWFQHKLPPYLRHPPEQTYGTDNTEEKQERVVDPEVIEEVNLLPFLGITRALVLAAASSSDASVPTLPKFTRDLRVAYELVLDHKHTRLRVMEVQQAAMEAAVATPPAFSPGQSRGATPGEGSFTTNSTGGASGGGVQPSPPPTTGDSGTSTSPSSRSFSPGPGTSSPPLTSGADLARQQHQFAEEASRALMRGAQGGRVPPSSLTPVNPPPNQPVQMVSSIPGNVGMLSQHQQGRRTRRWYLGIQSKKDPAHVMTEVYKALVALGCEWLQLSSYRIKCRWLPNKSKRRGSSSVPGGGSSGPGGSSVLGGVDEGEGEGKKGSTEKRRRGEEEEEGGGGKGGGGEEEEDERMDENVTPPSGGDAAGPAAVGPRASQKDRNPSAPATAAGPRSPLPSLLLPTYSVKLGLTLYKVQHGIYLLDFQKVTGDSFTFMSLCASIIGELKTLSAAGKLQQQQAALLAQQQQQARVQSDGRRRTSQQRGDELPPPVPPSSLASETSSSLPTNQQQQDR